MVAAVKGLRDVEGLRYDGQHRRIAAPLIGRQLSSKDAFTIYPIPADSLADALLTPPYCSPY